MSFNLFNRQNLKLTKFTQLIPLASDASYSPRVGKHSYVGELGNFLPKQHGTARASLVTNKQLLLFNKKKQLLLLHIKRFIRKCPRFRFLNLMPTAQLNVTGSSLQWPNGPTGTHNCDQTQGPKTTQHVNVGGSTHQGSRDSRPT